MPFDISVNDLGRIVEFSLNEIYLFDLDSLKFKYVNHSALENLGYSEDELAELTPLDIKPQLTAGHFQELLAPLRQKAETPVKFETIHKRKNGSNYFVEVHLQLARYRGETLACAIILDVTERVNAERERAVAESQRYQAQNFQNMGVLASGLAHDFNNVLASMMGNVDLALLECPPKTELHTILKELLTGIDQIAALTLQMQYYSGIGKRQTRLVNLQELLEQMQIFLLSIIPGNCRIDYAFAPDLPAIEIDANQIRQVIVNLVYNAAEAIGDGAGRISITVTKEYCDLDYLALWFPNQRMIPNEYLILKVADNGIGIEPETISRVLDPFFTTKPAKSGLGLSAALGIVLGHRGNLAVYSEHGVGSAIVILFPLPQENPGLLPGRRESAPTAIASHSGVVLLVESSEPVRLLLGKILNRAGFTVITAKDGQEALNLFAFRHEELLVVIFGLSIPDNCDGTSLKEILDIDNSVPLLVSSGFAIPTATERILAGSEFRFLQKPYHVRDLLAALSSVLDAS